MGFEDEVEQSIPRPYRQTNGRSKTLQADGEYEVRVYGLKHQKEKRSMDHFAGLDVSGDQRLHCG